MTTVRIASARDLPEVARLFERCFPDHGWVSRPACEAYFREMLFENPWHAMGLPSWLAEADGRVVGFYGVMPRPMRFKGRPIRVAVGCSFMVDPDKRNSLIALQLVRAHMSGPQDLTLADGATEHALGMWTRIGGRAPLGYNLHWLRPLRPARHALHMLEQRNLLPRLLCATARPLAALADAMAVRLRVNRFLRSTEFRLEPLDPARLVADFDAVAGQALVPAYDPPGVSWLLAQARKKTRRHGRLRARRVCDRQGRVLGWYLCYLRRGGPGELVQLAARDEAYDDVLRCLLADAWRHGATALRGRLDASRAEALSRHHCWLRWEGPATLVHARDLAIVAAIEHGDAFLSRLEGEWWMRFVSG